jgi:hypothetical protein
LLALDDFGSGYSSLAYLQRFPFDTIKIDKELVQASSGDIAGAGAAIVRSIVALSHELGKKVVAEGVEHADDVGFLRSLGAEYAQGFYYGEAMPDKEVIGLLRVIRKSERKLHKRGFFRTKPQMPGAQPEPIAVAGASATGKTKTRRNSRGKEPAAAAGGGGGGIAAANHSPETGRDNVANIGTAPPRPVLPPRIGNDMVPGAVRVRPRILPPEPPQQVPHPPQMQRPPMPSPMPEQVTGRHGYRQGSPKDSPSIGVGDRVRHGATDAPQPERQLAQLTVRPSAAAVRPSRIQPQQPTQPQQSTMSPLGGPLNSAQHNRASPDQPVNMAPALPLSLDEPQPRRRSIAEMFPTRSTAPIPAVADPVVTPVPPLPSIVLPGIPVAVQPLAGAPRAMAQTTTVPPSRPAEPPLLTRPTGPANLKGLPPAIAASLAKLAGNTAKPTEDSKERSSK